MTLAEAARRDPRLLVLRCSERLQISLERNTRFVPRDGRFHVRVRGRLIFSGAFDAAVARFECARAAHLRRHAARRPELPARQRSTGGGQRLPAVRRPDGRYAGQRRVSWRVLVPAAPPEACERRP